MVVRTHLMLWISLNYLQASLQNDFTKAVQRSQSSGEPTSSTYTTEAGLYRLGAVVAIHLLTELFVGLLLKDEIKKRPIDWL